MLYINFNTSNVNNKRVWRKTKNLIFVISIHQMLLINLAPVFVFIYSNINFNTSNVINQPTLL